MVRKVFAGRVRFHDGDSEIADGITVHHVGGHSKGLQVVRVWTRRGWLVVASDASHFYANMEQGRAFPIMHSLADTLEGYDRLWKLASDRTNVIPGHDPIILDRYPAPSSGLEGIVVRLDADPRSQAALRQCHVALRGRDTLHGPLDSCAATRPHRLARSGPIPAHSPATPPRAQGRCFARPAGSRCRFDDS